MHQALQIAEILSLIFDIVYEDRSHYRSLKSLACVNKFISHHALSKLWRNVTLQQMFLTFPQDYLGEPKIIPTDPKLARFCGQRNWTYFSPQRSLRSTDWERFDYYADFVRHVDVDTVHRPYRRESDLDLELFTQMKQSRPEETWFPHLKTIHYLSSADGYPFKLHNSATSLISLQKNSNELFDHFKMDMGRFQQHYIETVASCLDAILSSGSKALNDLRLDSFHLRYHLDALLNILSMSSFSNLELLFSDRSYDDSSLIEKIGQQYLLESLEIGVLSDSPWDKRAQMKRPTLANLQTLILHFTSPLMAEIHIGHFSLCSITHLELNLNFDRSLQNASDINILFRSIRAQPLQLQELHIDFYEFEASDDILPRDVQDSLYELLTIPTLEKLSVSAVDGTVNDLIHDTLLRELSRHSTDIYKIIIVFDGDESMWTNLASFAKTLHHLPQLTAIDINQLEIVQDFAEGVDPAPQVTQFYFGFCYGGQIEDAERYGEDLSKIFPNLEKVCLCQVEDGSVCERIRNQISVAHFDDDDYDVERPSPGLEIYLNPKL